MARYEPHDHYFEKAKKDGFAARSIYKLEEIDRKLRILRAGARVLDLGAAPGSWMQYAARVVGERGLVVGIDLMAITARLGANTRALRGDAFNLLPDALLEPLGGGDAHYDAVLSDMAPATTGDRFVDQQRSADLCLRALEIARCVLRAGGTFVAKALEGESTRVVQAAVRDAFEEMKVVRPDSTRKGSTEVFIVGLRRKPLHHP